MDCRTTLQARLVLILFLVLAMLLTACRIGATPVPTEGTPGATPTITTTTTPRGTPSAQTQTVKLGGLFPYTGALQEFGPDFEKGAKLAIKHLRDAGIAIELVTADDQTSVTGASTSARQLIETDKVHAIVGPAPSLAVITVAQDITIPAGVVLVSPFGFSSLLTSLPADQGKDLVFRTVPSEALQGVVLGRLAKQLNFTKAAIIYVDNPYGQGLAENFEKSFKEQGGTVTAKVRHPEEPVQTSYNAELRQAAQGAPDVLVAVSYPQHAAVYLKEAIEGNFIKEFLFVDGTKSEDIIKALGAQGVEGMHGTAPGAAESDSLTRFNQAYQAEHGRLSALPFVTNTYDATILLGLAAYKAQIDGKGLKGDAIRDALRAIASPTGDAVVAGADGIKKAVELIKQGKDINYEGAAGAQDFDANGDVVTPIEVWQYAGGQIKSLRMEQP